MRHQRFLVKPCQWSFGFAMDPNDFVATIISFHWNPCVPQHGSSPSRLLTYPKTVFSVVPIPKLGVDKIFCLDQMCFLWLQPLPVIASMSVSMQLRFVLLRMSSISSDKMAFCSQKLPWLQVSPSISVTWQMSLCEENILEGSFVFAWCVAFKVSNSLWIHHFILGTVYATIPPSSTISDHS